MDKLANPFSEIGKQVNDELYWDDARVFLAVARTGTLSGAAKMLGLGLATASRRLERLEAALGVALFTRDQGGHRLTDDGRALVSRAEALEQAGCAFGAAAQGRTDQVAGHVRLATTQMLADDFIVPALPRLLTPHPDLSVEIVTGVATVNLHRRDADLAIRLVKPERGNLSIRRLGVVGFGLYASTDYLRRQSATPRETTEKHTPRPSRAASLDHHAKGGDSTFSTLPRASTAEKEAFIGWTEIQQHLPAAQWLARTLRGRPCRLLTSAISTQMAAARAGLGLAVLPHWLAQEQRLVCVRRDIGCDQPIWLAIHADLAHSRRVRLVADFLSELVLDNAALLQFGQAK